MRRLQLSLSGLLPMKCTAVVLPSKKKCIAVELTDAMDLETLLSRFFSLIEDVACKESAPHIDEKQAFIVVRHIKFGLPKSGGKKASKTSTIESSKNDPSKEDEEYANDSVQTKTPELAVSDFQNVVKVPTKNEQVNAAASVPKQVTENRYAKVSRVVNEQNTSQIPNPGKQPHFNDNPLPRIPNQIPNLGTQDSPRPSFPNLIPNLGRQDSPRPSFPNSPNKGFGIFSA